MILAADSSGKRSLGAFCTVPNDWETHIAPWASFECREGEFGISLIQKLELPYCFIQSWILEIENPVGLYMLATAPTIELQFNLDGNMILRQDGVETPVFEEGKFGLLYIPAGAFEITFEPGRYESLHIELGAKWLEIIVQDHPGIAELLSGLNQSGKKGTRLVGINIKYTTMTILQNLRNCNRIGGNLLLEMYKFILELLSEYVGELERNDHDELRSYHPHHVTMVRIHNFIISAPNIHEHTIPRLSRKFNQSETVIKKNFQNLFKTALSDFVRYHALVKAALLVTTTRRSVEDIAEEIGYSSREALERAFKKQFGYSPSSLRSGLNR